MATVYLCIGTQKTGTTYLQRFMRNNAKALKKQGYCYPKMDELGFGKIYKDRNAHFLAYLSRGRDIEQKKRDIQKKRSEGYKILAALAKEYENIVLSDEIIWYQCNKFENFWQELVEEFHKIDCEVKVVVYLRRQDQVIQSLWNQRVKGIPGITREFSECIKNGGLDWFSQDYYAQLQKILPYVGKDKLLVRVYERGQFGGEDHTLLSDYLETIGVKLTDDFILEEQEANYGLTGNFIELKRIMNGIPEYQEMDNFMRTQIVNASVYQAALNKEEKTSMFTYDELVAYMGRFEESNQKVAREFLGREDGVLFHEPLKEGPVWKVREDTMYRDLLTFMVEMFCSQEKEITRLTKKVRKLSSELELVKKSDRSKDIKDMEQEIKEMRDSLIFKGYRKARRVIKK